MSLGGLLFSEQFNQIVLKGVVSSPFDPQCDTKGFVFSELLDDRGRDPWIFHTINNFTSG